MVTHLRSVVQMVQSVVQGMTARGPGRNLHGVGGAAVSGAFGMKGVRGIDDLDDVQVDDVFGMFSRRYGVGSVDG